MHTTIEPQNEVISVRQQKKLRAIALAQHNQAVIAKLQGHIDRRVPRNTSPLKGNTTTRRHRASGFQAMIPHASQCTFMKPTIITKS